MPFRACIKCHSVIVFSTPALQGRIAASLPTNTAQERRLQAGMNLASLQHASSAFAAGVRRMLDAHGFGQDPGMQQQLSQHMAALVAAGATIVAAAEDAQALRLSTQAPSAQQTHAADDPALVATWLQTYLLPPILHLWRTAFPLTPHHHQLFSLQLTEACQAAAAQPRSEGSMLLPVALAYLQRQLSQQATEALRMQIKAAGRGSVAAPVAGFSPYFPAQPSFQQAGPAPMQQLSYQPAVQAPMQPPSYQQTVQQPMQQQTLPPGFGLPMPAGSAGQPRRGPKRPQPQPGQSCDAWDGTQCHFEAATGQHCVFAGQPGGHPPGINTSNPTKLGRLRRRRSSRAPAGSVAYSTR